MEETLHRIHEIWFLDDDNITSIDHQLMNFEQEEEQSELSTTAMKEDLNSKAQTLGGASHATINIIQPENTRAMILHSPPPRSISKQNLLFHLIHTSSEETFGTMQMRCIESIFYHHPLATVLFYVKNMTDAPVKYIMQAGYDLQVIKYDIVEHLYQLERDETVDASIVQNFTSRIKDFASDDKGYWYVNESDLLRLIVLYLHGGIYLGMLTDFLKTSWMELRLCLPS